MDYKKYAQKEIEKFLTENEDYVGLFPKFEGLMISARGIPMPIMESEDSSLILDMDNTLIIAIPTDESLLELLEKGTNDFSQYKRGERVDPDQIEQAMQKHPHKDRMELIRHEEKGKDRSQMVIYRPKLKEFLGEVAKLVKSKDLREALIYTANPEDWAVKITDALNNYAGTNMRLWWWRHRDQLHTDSIIVDDSEWLAPAKLDQTGVVKRGDDIASRWVQPESFTGNLNDRELTGQVLEDIKELLSNL